MPISLPFKFKMPRRPRREQGQRREVVLQSAASEAAEGKHVAQATAIEAVLSIAWVFGIALSLAGVLAGGSLVLAAVGSVVCVLLGVVAAATGRGTRVALVALALGLVLLFAIVGVPGLREYLLAVVGALVSRLDGLYDHYVSLPMQLGTTSKVLSESSSALPFCVAGGVILGATGWELVRNRRIMLMSAITTVVLFAGVWLRATVSFVPLILIIASAVCLWGLSVARSDSRLRVMVPGVCLMVVASLVGLVFFSSTNAHPSLDRFHSNSERAAKSVRYGQDTLPEGDLTRANELNQDSLDRLRLSFEQAPTYDLYLRGFVGADFSDTQWQPLSYRAYEDQWKGMKEWLGEKGFASERQHALLADELVRVQGAESPKSLTVGVESVGASRRYVYLPAQLRELQGATIVPDRDGAPLAEGVVGDGSYTIQIDNVDAAAEAAESPAWQRGSEEREGYPQSESVYRSFVEDNYLELSDEDREVIEAVAFDPESWTEEDAKSLPTVISRVRIMLATYAAYDEEPAAYTGSDPFLMWFLAGVHEGNSAYFSTAAVAAFRSQGYPARYVEGYYASADAMAGAVGDGSLTLTSKDAHAWVEVYVDGVGWCPVEVTPGFYQQRFAAQNVIEVNQQQAGGSADRDAEAGVLEGDIQDEQLEREKRQPLAMTVLLGIAGVLVFACVVVALMLGIFEIRRAVLRRRWREACASDDQAVCVPGLYDQATRYIRAAGITFDPTRPLDSTSDLGRRYPIIDSQDYERFVQIVQSSVFGMRKLRANELRTMRTFVERLREGLGPAQSLRQRMERRYRFGV